jgi:hypothetical protein
MRQSFCILVCATLFFFCLTSFTQAQVGYSLNTLSDGNGNPILTKKAVIGESAYLFDKNYLNGILYLEGTEKAITGNKFKLNLQNSKLYYMDANGEEMEVASSVKRIVFTGAGEDGADIVFEKGFPAVDKLGNENFYRVLVQGKALLLQDTKFVEVEYKEYNSASTARRTDKLVSYYGVTGNRISRLSKPEDVLLLLADRTKQVSDYMKQENSKVKKAADLEKVFRYYNGIAGN